MAPRRPDPFTEGGGAAGAGRARPDAASGRLALGVGGLAAASALVTAIVAPPTAAVPAGPVAGAPPAAQPATVILQRPVQYIQLAPGQSPPPGARVIDAKAPKPITVVTTVPAPPQQTVIVRTTQSGVVLP